MKSPGGQAPIFVGRRARLPALLASAMFLVAACASEEAPTTPAPPAAQPSPTPPAPPPPPEPATPIIMAVDFDAAPLGDYTHVAFSAEWPDYRDVEGFGEERAEIVEGAAAYSGRSLRLKFPAGTRQLSVGAMIQLGQSYEELFLSYRVRFEEGFDFVRGGKLPGLFGGRGNAGGQVPDGTDGWSGRMMWREEGEATQYLYHPDQPGMYGEFFWWERRFEPGTWHTVEHHFTMNTPGEHDGTLRTWFDGEDALRVDRLRFRDTATFGIGGLRVETYFGGGDDTWNSTKDEYIYFDDFVISTERIGQ